jgi:type IV pilus assembly protein PilF
MLKRNALIFLTISAIITACSQLSSFEKHDLDAANVHLQLGQHYLAMNMLDIAKENLELALKEDSSNVPAHNTLAVLYNRIGQPENAKEEFEKALSYLTKILAY